MLPEKSEGNASIVDKREMKNPLNQRDCFVGRKMLEDKKFGGLVKQDNQKNQTVKTAQERRFFFSSSSWHLMQRRAWGTAKSLFCEIALEHSSQIP